MPKIKVFIVVPYEGLGELTFNIARQYPMFDIRTEVGNLDQGVEAAARAQQDGYQMIISRGGTAEMIQEAVSIPVISIDISGYDYMRVIALTHNFSGKAAIVGYHSITEGAQAIKTLLRSEIDIFTIENSRELPGLLSELRRRDYLVIVGDTITVEKAKEMSFNAILLTSGEESVKKAFNDALKIYEYIQKYSLKTELLMETLRQIPQYCAVFDCTGNIVYQKLPEEDTGKVAAELAEYSKIVLSSGEQQALLDLGGHYWNETGTRIYAGGNHPYAVFYLSKCIDQKSVLKGITAESVQNTADFSITVFGRSSTYLRETYEEVQKFSKLCVPILITGEIGTGKDALAKMIHSMSVNRQHPFVTIDGEIADSDSLKNSRALIDSDPSSTLYLKQLQALSLQNQRILLEMLAAPDFTRTHLLLTSVCESPETMMVAGTLLEELGKRVGEYRIHLPSLRERSGDMRDLTSNYINLANSQYGKQIVAVDDGGLKLLTDFHWVTNLDQLQRIVFKLVMEAEEPYISAESVSEVLKAETDLQPVHKNVSDKTLDEQIQDIIRNVMNEENGNLTRVSNRLGVSRTTIWRRMKNE
ncbi:PrpR N-terminal domain-containing protein [Caproiciproducens sp. R1]|uniref:PrpR N-terminal domain-containing protein n=1 Tax=Caproiciproducens sp. R1 TaxID=3435000 RepID=UPI0040343DDC